MKEFEEKFPKPDKLQIYYYPNELIEWESKQKGWKAALEWAENQFIGKTCFEAEEAINRELRGRELEQ